MCDLLHDKSHIPRLFQKMTLSDVLSLTHQRRTTSCGTSLSKSIRDRWTYCNQERIARKALEMYKNRQSDGDIKNLIKEFNSSKLTQTKMASLWEPPNIRMKRPTSKGKMFSEKEFGEGDSAGNVHLLKHIENQDWPNLIIILVADRGRVVRATNIIERGIM